MVKKRVTYTDEQIEEFAHHLRNMKEPRKAGRSKIEAVQMLKGEIQKLRDRGFTLEQIADGLTGVGMEITTPTLGSYLKELNDKKGAKNKRKKKNTTAQARKATAPEAMTAPAAQPSLPSLDEDDGMISPDAIRNL